MALATPTHAHNAIDIHTYITAPTFAYINRRTAK